MPVTWEEVNENSIEIQKLIEAQKFTIGDANKFMKRYYNYSIMMERLFKSRKMWRERYEKLKSEFDTKANKGGKNNGSTIR